MHQTRTDTALQERRAGAAVVCNHLWTIFTMLISFAMRWETKHGEQFRKKGYCLFEFFRVSRRRTGWLPPGPRVDSSIIQPVLACLVGPIASKEKERVNFVVAERFKDKILLLLGACQISWSAVITADAGPKAAVSYRGGDRRFRPPS